MSSILSEASLRVYGCQLRGPACFARSFEFGERLFFPRGQLVGRRLGISCGIGGGLAVGVAAARGSLCERAASPARPILWFNPEFSTAKPLDVRL